MTRSAADLDTPNKRGATDRNRMVSIWAGDNPREALVRLSAPVMTTAPRRWEWGRTRAVSVGLTLQQAAGAGADELSGTQVCAPMGRWRDASAPRHIPEAGAGAD